MTTVSNIQENVTAETAQTSAGLLGRFLDWMINALDAYFGVAGGTDQQDHMAEDFRFSNTCCCG